MTDKSREWLLQLSAKSRNQLSELPSRHQPTWYRLRVTEAAVGSSRPSAETTAAPQPGSSS